MKILRYANVSCVLHNSGKRQLLKYIPNSCLSRSESTSSNHNQNNLGDFKNKWASGPALYPGHIPTTSFQKTLLTLGSAYMALADPYRDDMVAVLGETTGDSVLKKLLAKMQSSSEGSEILRDRPRINTTTVELQALKELPPSSFGNVYATFMEKHGITSDSRQPVHFVDDVDCAYVIQRYREAHDLVHALLDMPTNMLGEVAVKWVEALQTQLPMCIGAALFGPLKLKPKQREKYRSLYLPWAIRCGLEAELLLNVYYEKRWTQPVDELRKELNIPPLVT